MAKTSNNPWVQRAPEPASTESPVLNVKQAAQFLGCSERTVYQLTKDGQLACIRFGTAEKCPAKYLREDLVNFLRSHRKPAKVETTQTEGGGV
ncbi:MAG: helix-turn-helix domain-containing protein [Thermoguttaceae bacterium]